MSIEASICFTKTRIIFVEYDKYYAAMSRYNNPWKLYGIEFKYKNGFLKPEIKFHSKIDLKREVRTYRNIIILLNKVFIHADDDDKLFFF